MVICNSTMQLKLPYYTSRDYSVLALILLPISIVLNSIILGIKYYSSWQIFIVATVLACFAFAINFTLCGGWAVLMKRRFPEERQVGIKLSVMILTFIVITGFFLASLFKGYELIPMFNYTFNERIFFLAYIGMGIVNVFITLLMEGLDRYEKWNNSLKETEELKKVFKQSQLQGLKSQLNPHFLFNSLNSLSSLIQDDEEKAERFLNEMSKVYRYMLRNDEDHLVSLQAELQFVESYFYLLKARYGEGLQLSVRVSDAAAKNLLPPLSLQVLIENAFTQNSMSKASPLCIAIDTPTDTTLIVHNNVQPKLVTEEIHDMEAELDHLVNKFQLLNQSPVLIKETGDERSIRLPLIVNKEEVAV